MNKKKFIALFLCFAMLLTAFAGSVMTAANAEGGTVTFSYVVTTNQIVSAFDAALTYPKDSLSVSSIEVMGDGEFYDNKKGKIMFNNTNVENQFDFSQGEAMITVTFNVIDDYDKRDVAVNMEEIYSVDTILGGNIPYRYANVFDGTVDLSGYVNVDDHSQDYTDPTVPPEKTYTVIYSYAQSPDDSTDATLTKTITTAETDIGTIAEAAKPRIENPYYTNYRVSSPTLDGENTIRAALACDEKKYSVIVNGEEYAEKGYLETVNLTAEQNSAFIIDGEVVATGTKFSFFVTDDVEVVIEQSSAAKAERVSLLKNALSISDNPENSADSKVQIELLATASRENFARMGVAIAAAPKDADDISNAVHEVTTGSAVSDKILIHNSKVDRPNVSGQYQFIYAPYFSASKAPSNSTLYCYAYSVNKNDEVMVSSVQVIDLTTILS